MREYLLMSSRWTVIETCPLRPEEHGTERPLQNHVAITFVEAARFWGGQIFVSFINEIDPVPPGILN
jgi:hypothetical protein